MAQDPLTTTNFPNGIDVGDGTNGGISVNGTQIVNASGTLLSAPDITVAGVTTTIGLALDDNTALTSGKLIKVASSATASTSAGRLFLSDHTGVTTTSGVLNEFKTAANDESVLLNLTAAALTTGTVLDFGTTAGLTTGIGLKMAHTTSVIADTGSLVRISSSSIDTGGATNGTLLDLKSTAQLAGTLVRLDTIATTGTAMSVISTGIMTTTGNLLTLTANSATTAAGLLRVNGDGLTTGNLAVLSSNSADTGTRILVKIVNDNTAATGTTPLTIQNDATAGAHIALTGTGILGIDFTALTSADCLFNATAGVGCTAAPQTNAAVGFLNIKVGGTDQWIPYYNAT